MSDAATVPIRSDTDLSRIRQEVRSWAQRTGFGLVQQTKLVTAASELARNTLIHGGGGRMEINRTLRADRQGLRLNFVDHGPGIGDLAQAFTDGYSTVNGLGMGLGGSRRLVDEFTIDTRPGEGTTVTITAWAAPADTSRTKLP